MMIRGSCIPLLFVFFVLPGTLKSANCQWQYNKKVSSSNDEEQQAWRKFKEFTENWSSGVKKIEGNLFGGKDTNELNHIRGEDRLRSLSLNKKQPTGSVVPPPIDQPALMGRFIVNQAEWTSIATISIRKEVSSFPVVNLASVSDGPLGNGTGIPYMYLTPLDFTAQDLARDHRATLLMTLAQGDYCKDKDMDPMDPRCARIMLTGSIQEIKPSDFEHEVAKNAVFGRHPWLAHMPENHHFFFAKLKISSIVVLDTFGGPKYITVEDYMNPPTLKNREKHLRHQFNTWRDGNSRFENEGAIFAYRV